MTSQSSCSLTSILQSRCKLFAVSIPSEIVTPYCNSLFLSLLTDPFKGHCQLVEWQGGTNIFLQYLEKLFNCTGDYPDRGSYSTCLGQIPVAVIPHHHKWFSKVHQVILQQLLNFLHKGSVGYTIYDITTP